MSLRLAYVVTHPIQYQAPLLRLIAGEPDMQLKVFFLDDLSLHEHHESAFDHTFRWDVPLTEGYDWEVLASQSSCPSRFRLVKGLKERLRAGKFDAVWVHGWGRLGLLQAIGAAVGLGIPVFLRGESTPGSGKTTLCRYLRDQFLRRLFTKISAFLFIGKLNREFYRLHKIPNKRLFFVPYAVNNDWFRARCQEAAVHRLKFREDLGLSPDRAVILFAAKFIPEKAPQDLLSAFLEVIHEPGLRKPYLLFVGNGPLRSKLEAQAGNLLGKDVRFLGFRNQTEMPAFYDLCDVFVLPSRFEPWGLVVNEVMNAGRPVIVSDKVGAAADLVRNHDNGWIFPAGDVSALADRIRNAITTADLNQMGLNSGEIIQ